MVPFPAFNAVRVERSRSQCGDATKSAGSEVTLWVRPGKSLRRGDVEVRREEEGGGGAVVYVLVRVCVCTRDACMHVYVCMAVCVCDCVSVRACPRAHVCMCM